MKRTALRRTAGLATAALLVGLIAVSVPAGASESSVTGDCDGWTVHLDGTWGAYWITIDGVTIYGAPGGQGSDGQGTPIDYFVADTSDTTTRTFEVVWYNHTTGVTTHNPTGTRDVDCDPPDTSVPEDTTSTTVDDTTSTTVEDTTSTTVEDTTTTTVPVETSSTSIATTSTTDPDTPDTVPPEVSSTTIQPTTTGGGTTDTLPFTGLGTDGLALIAFAALVAGAGLILLTRRASDGA